VTRRLREHVGLDRLSPDGATALWRELRRAVTRFAAGDDTRVPRGPMSDAGLRTERVRDIPAHLPGPRAAVRRLAATTYPATGACRVNPYLGALCVQAPGATPEAVGAAEVPSQTTAWAT